MVGRHNFRDKEQLPEWVSIMFGCTAQTRWKNHRDATETGTWGTAAEICFSLAIYNAFFAFWSDSWRLLVITSVIAGLATATGRALSDLDDRVRQRHRNAQATALIESLDPVTIKDSEGEVSLFLRPFETAGRLFTSNPRFLPVVFYTRYYFDVPWLELESFLAKMISLRGPLVALGQFDTYIGAGRYSSEKEWQDAFKIIARYARTVFVVPVDREGTREEIVWLKANHLFRKVVFIMPPTEPPLGYPFRLSPPRVPSQMRIEWERSARTFQDISLELPTYNNGGLMFNITGEGKVIKTVPIITDNTQKFYEALVDLDCAMIRYFISGSSL